MNQNRLEKTSKSGMKIAIRVPYVIVGGVHLAELVIMTP